mmetsp:Transcript_47792/g.35039  ORF Transcript_47792/g.35039 Transcript_47792/m.35039 type:complete len:170 (-) Transcript_47792:1606-2115(-)
MPSKIIKIKETEEKAIFMDIRNRTLKDKAHKSIIQTESITTTIQVSSRSIPSRRLPTRRRHCYSFLVLSCKGKFFYRDESADADIPGPAESFSVFVQQGPADCEFARRQLWGSDVEGGRVVLEFLIRVCLANEQHQLPHAVPRSPGDDSEQQLRRALSTQQAVLQEFEQ